MSDYYTEFKNFNLYTKQIESIAKVIYVLVNGTRFVDVGCNDGELTNQILDKCNITQTYAFEPDPASFEQLKLRFSKNENIQIDNLNFNQWIEKYQSKLKCQINLVLNSHTLYHFPKESWKSIITQCNDILTPDGKHIIIIDSDKTSINNLKPQLDEVLGIKEKIGNYGDFLYGKYIEKFLKSHQINYQHQIINQPIIIPVNETAVHIFARIIGFVFRYDPNEILKCSQPQIIQFMEQYKQDKEYIFPRYQEVFILNK